MFRSTALSLRRSDSRSYSNRCPHLPASEYQPPFGEPFSSVRGQPRPSPADRLRRPAPPAPGSWFNLPCAVVSLVAQTEERDIDDPRERAARFLQQARDYQLGDLPTESRHPLTGDLADLSRHDLPRALRLLKQIDCSCL